MTRRARRCKLRIGPDSRVLTGVMWGAVGVLCFSGTAPATRIAGPAFGPATLTFARILIAALLAAAVLRLMPSPPRPRRSQLPSLALMGLGLAVGFPLFLAIAVERVPAAHAAVMIGLVPAATATLSVLRTSERPPRLFWLGCAGGLAAVLAFAVSQGGGIVNSADVWLLAAVASCAVGYVEGGRLAHQIGPIPALCWAMTLLAPLALIGLALSIANRPVADPSPDAWAGLLYAGIMSMFAGSIAWYQGLAAGGIARIGQLNLLQPLLAITWSALILGEHIPNAVPITALAVLAAMTLCIKTRHTSTKPSAHFTNEAETKPPAKKGRQPPDPTRPRTPS